MFTYSHIDIKMCTFRCSLSESTDISRCYWLGQILCGLLKIFITIWHPTWLFFVHVVIQVAILGITLYSENNMLVIQMLVRIISNVICRNPTLRTHWDTVYVVCLKSLHQHHVQHVSGRLSGYTAKFRDQHAEYEIFGSIISIGICRNLKFRTHCNTLYGPCLKSLHRYDILLGCSLTMMSFRVSLWVSQLVLRYIQITACWISICLSRWSL